PGIVHIEGFDLDPLMDAPHSRIMVYCRQSEPTWPIGAGLIGEETEHLAIQRLLDDRIETRLPLLRESKLWIQGSVEGVKSAEEPLDRRRINTPHGADSPCGTNICRRGRSS